MQDSTLWWLLAGAAAGLELVTGTFYLLMLALGLVAGALAAHAGLTPPLQMACAAVLGVAGVLALRQWRQGQHEAPAQANHDVFLDIGATVQVDQWNPDGTARIPYRGAQWSVACVAGETPQPGAHRVVEVVGSCLIVRHL